jgi:arabinogalactan oligomer/maltooligosaccharide transport system substrate-binding protein
MAVTTTATTTAEISPMPSASATPTSEASDPTMTATTPDASVSAPPTTAPNSLTVWHGYAADSPEARILNDVIAATQQASSEAKIAVLQIPGDQIINRFETEAAAGGGPDLLFASNDSLGRQARAGLLRDLDSALAPQANLYLPAALDGMKVAGKLYGIPGSLTTIALYYNQGKIQSPPRTTDELLNAVKSGAKIVLIQSAFHNFGFFGAFGGRLFDEAGRCVADAGGFAQTLAYLRELKQAGAQFVTSGREAETVFKEGQADLTINGSWLLADYRASLGDHLRVAPLPGGPAGPARSLTSVVGVYINANSDQFDQAVALGLALTNQATQQRLVEQSPFVPTNPNVTIADPAVASLFEAAKVGTPYPHMPELDRFWRPFDAALAEVLDTDADPVAAVQSACAAMNEANGR